MPIRSKCDRERRECTAVAKGRGTEGPTSVDRTSKRQTSNAIRGTRGAAPHCTHYAVWDDPAIGEYGRRWDMK